MKYLIAGLLFCFSAVTHGAEPPRAVIETNLGAMTIELYHDKAPISVRNFVNYAQEGTYNKAIFHRVIKNFMIQAGGYTQDYQKIATSEPIMNEATNGLKNLRGMVAMARTAEPHSATSQFFINVRDNNFLNHTSKSPRGWGYSVFGKVVEGMEVVDKIQKLKTGPAGELARHVPREAVVINSVTLSNLPDFSAPLPESVSTEAIDVEEETADDVTTNGDIVDDDEDSDVIDEEETEADDAENYADDGEEVDTQSDEALDAEDDISDEEMIDSEDFDTDLEEDTDITEDADASDIIDEDDTEIDEVDEEALDEESVDSEEDTDKNVDEEEAVIEEKEEAIAEEEPPVVEKEEPKSPSTPAKTPKSNASIPPDPPSKPDSPEPPA